MFTIRRVVGHSMLPAYPEGKVVIAMRVRRPRPGDVVVLRHQGREMLKRVASVNTHHMFVVGDNPQASTDSRQWGWLPRSHVLGVVLGGGL